MQYSIYKKNGVLFACFEYTGNDFEADLLKMCIDVRTQEWCLNMEEIFHLD